MCGSVCRIAGAVRAHHRKGRKTHFVFWQCFDLLLLHTLPHRTPGRTKLFSRPKLMPLSQVAESIPLAIQRFKFSSAFSAVSILSWAPGIPDLVLAVLFACQNDISAAIDVGLAAATTTTM
jgi:hypothetical protein